MAKKKKKKEGGSAPAQRPVVEPAEQSLPAPLRAIDADYSAVFRMRNTRWIVVLLSVIAALWLVIYLPVVFVPVLVALGIAYILNPLVARLEKRGMRRSRAVLLIFLLFLIFAGGIGTWFVYSIVADAQRLGSQIDEIINDVKGNQDEWIASYNEGVPEFLRLDPDEVNLDVVLNYAKEKIVTEQSEVESPEESSARAAHLSARANLLSSFQMLDKNNDLRLSQGEIDAAAITEMDGDENGDVSTQEWFGAFGAGTIRDNGRTITPAAQMAAGDLASSVLSGVVTIFTILLIATLLPIYTWYFMIGFNRFTKKVHEHLPGAHRPRIERIVREIDETMRAFFRGRIIVVLIVTAATTVVYLAFGVPYAVLLGFISGLGVLIPYFSIVAGWAPALLLMLISGNSWGAIVGMSVCFHAIQIIEQYVLTPKLLGDAVELHPVTVLVGVFVMGSLFGIVGALLAVPLTAIAKTLGKEFVLPYFRSLAADKPRKLDAPAGTS